MASPDLNPIENLWKSKKLTIVTELWKTFEEEWNKIIPEQCRRLVMSCGHRYAQVIESKQSLYTFY